MAELCLGTVQFGMDYGINNQLGRQPSWEESYVMLDYALEHGIDTIDTASAYGESERILGEYFRRRGGIKDIKIISKLRPNVISRGQKDISGILEKELMDSLGKLRVSGLDGYLLHTPEYIYNLEIMEVLLEFKRQKFVKNIGVSIYNLQEGYAAIETGVVDYIQLPYSILDQRGIREGFIHKAKKAGITIFTRSAFLQGLFLMEQHRIPTHLQKARDYLTVIGEISNRYHVDMVSLVLGFVKAETDIDYLVFGVEKMEQLVEDINKYQFNDIPKKCVREIKEKINNVEESIIFPSLWSNGRRAE